MVGHGSWDHLWSILLTVDVVVGLALAHCHNLACGHEERQNILVGVHGDENKSVFFHSRCLFTALPAAMMLVAPANALLAHYSSFCYLGATGKHLNTCMRVEL